MVSAAFRGVVALLPAIMIASPASARLGAVSDWLSEVPQPSALVLLMVAIGGVLVGRLASRKRRGP